MSDLLLLRLIESALEPWVTDAPCLEIASGSARVARNARKHGVEKWIALDIEPMMLPQPAPGLAPIVGDATRLPFRSESFGCAVTWSGLHYIGAQQGLAEMFRVLRPTGAAVAAQKVADSLRNHIDWYREVQRLRSTAAREWYFSEDLAHVGLRAGFVVANVVHYQQWHRVDAQEWASRGGYFNRVTTQRLRDLAARGLDDDFAKETGFRYDGDVVEYPIDWAIIRWQKAPVARTR